MPTYPRSVGICASLHRARTNSRSGVAISSSNVSAIAASARLLHLLGAFEHLFDGPLHVESLLRDCVVLSVGDFLEALDSVGELHILALETGELLGHVEGLREKLLNFARPCHGDPVVFRQLVDTQNGD